jgi:diacylglycerol kinase (ATP)
MSNPQKYLFLLNPIAGGVDKEELIHLIENLSWNTLPQILWTEPDTGGYLKAMLISSPCDVLVAVGGDGTVRLAAEAVVGTDIRLGIIPMGSGNGLAKDLGLPQDPEEAITHLLESAPQPVDVITINGYRMYHIGDTGLNAQIVEDYAQGTFRTIGAYALQLFKYYFTFSPQQATIEIDGITVFDGEAVLVALCNGQRYGSDLILNPNGDVSDGKFEVVVMRPFNKALGPSLFLDLLQGDLDTEYFHTWSATNCHITTDEAWPWQIDGEFIGHSNTLEARIDVGIIQVLKYNSYHGIDSKTVSLALYR